MKKSIIAALVCTVVAFDATAQVRLLKSQPFTPTENGYFFTDPQELKIRTRLLDADYIERQLKLREAQVVLLETKVAHTEQLMGVYKDELEKSSKTVEQLAAKLSRSRWFYFFLGVGTAIALTFGVAAIQKNI